MRLSQQIHAMITGLGGAGIGTGLVLIWIGVPGPRPWWTLAFGVLFAAAGLVLGWILDRRDAQ